MDNDNMRSLEPSELQNPNVKSNNNFHHKEAWGTKNTIKRSGSHNNSELYSTTMPVAKKQKTIKSYPPVSVINTPRPQPMNTVSTSTSTPTPTPATNIDKTDDDENWVDDFFNSCDDDVAAEVDTAKLPNVISYSMVSDDESSFFSDFSQSFRQRQQEKKKRGRCDPTVPSLPKSSLPSTPRKQQDIPVAFDPYPILLKDCSRLPPPCTNPTTNKACLGEEDQGCMYSSSPLFQEKEEEGLDSVTNCKDPMFLTLTSYPFRVFYANQAYQTKTGIRNNSPSSSIIGKSFYEIFGGIKEGKPKNKPDFWSCKGILECGNYHPQQQDGNIMARIQVSPANGEEDDGRRDSSFYNSTVQVRPILKKSSTMPNNDADLRYFAVTLKPIAR